jgi:mannose/fructose/N-acetylgalactosamine-specific phosphotransferase system component IIC
MPRILRNYLISFVIIGIVLAVIHYVNRWADEKAKASAPQPTPQSESAAPTTK